MFELTTGTLIRALLFVLVFFMSYNILQRLFKDNKSVSGVIAFSISLITIYTINYEQLEATFLTAGTGGIIVLIGLPLVAAFFFIYSIKIESPIRKAFWVFYLGMNWFILSSLDRTPENMTSITMVLSGIFIVIMIFDKWIHKKFEEKRNLRGVRH